ncbi:MAG: helix-turn-helix domain-containing protein [Chlorobiales bacterium]|nr:helix-turn-helix domain-containing protein [Chlorobiales bacterium]
MIFPCEKAVWYNLPQIRADIASGLVKTGMTQSQAAKKLGVTPAAVSQYLNKKRGQQDVKSKAYLEEIGIAVEKVRDGATAEELQSIVCKCCQIITAETTGEDSQCKDNETE